MFRYTLRFLILRFAAFLFGIAFPLGTAALYIHNYGLKTGKDFRILLFLFLPAALICILLFLTRYFHYRPGYVDTMSGEDFEHYLKVILRRRGYRKIQTTQKTRDYGADLIMKKGLCKVVAQAKRYDHNIGVSAIQQALAAKAYYNAQEAVVITNRYFTPSARKLAEVNDVKLLDRSDLFGIPRN